MLFKNITLKPIIPMDKKKLTSQYSIEIIKNIETIAARLLPRVMQPERLTRTRRLLAWSYRRQQ